MRFGSLRWGKIHVEEWNTGVQRLVTRLLKYRNLLKSEPCASGCICVLSFATHNISGHKVYKSQTPKTFSLEKRFTNTQKEDTKTLCSIS
jgi:hypothetical protein